jgi:hypothetical protein
MEDLLEWDDTNVRVCILASLTYYFVVWNLQCRIWASFVRTEASKGERMDLARYETFVTTFRMRVRKMKEELNARSYRVKDLYDNMRNKRISNLEWKGKVKEYTPAHMDNNNVNTYFIYKDSYTNKEYSEYVKPYWYWSTPTDWQVSETQRVAENNYNNYKSGLTDFANRAIANDLAVVNHWAGIVHEAEVLLVPPAPKVPPVVDVSS